MLVLLRRGRVRFARDWGGPTEVERRPGISLVLKARWRRDLVSRDRARGAGCPGNDADLAAEALAR